MREGWIDDDYLILFTEEESVAATASYQVELALPGYSIVGLRGWDDFILLDPSGGFFTVPTVPLDAKYLESYTLPSSEQLGFDARFAGKIKWYVKPIIFGGDAVAADNIHWANHQEHVEFVVWWNSVYRSHSRSTLPK